MTRKQHDPRIMSPAEKLERAMKRDLARIKELEAENARLREAIREWRDADLEARENPQLLRDLNQNPIKMRDASEERYHRAASIRARNARARNRLRDLADLEAEASQ